MRVPPPLHSPVSADDQDSQLAGAVRLVRRQQWGWTTAAGFIAFLIVISVYSNKYNDVTDTGPAAVTVAAIVMVAATSVQLRHRAAAQRAQAVTAVAGLAARPAGSTGRSRPGYWSSRSG